MSSNRPQSNQSQKSPLSTIGHGILKGLGWYFEGADRWIAFFALSIVAMLVGIFMLYTGITEGKASSITYGILFILGGIGIRYVIDLWIKLTSKW